MTALENKTLSDQIAAAAKFSKLYGILQPYTPPKRTVTAGDVLQPYISAKANISGKTNGMILNKTV